MNSAGARTLRTRAVIAALSGALVAASAVAAPSSVAAADPIPDEGLPAEPVSASALVSERTEILQSGVVGYDYSNDTFPTLNSRVLAITEIDDVMYVGGKFTGVQRTAGASATNQRHLAAFDRNTGAWIDTFRPTLDGNVWDLRPAPDGDLLVAGQFTQVNGSTRTGIAKIDPVTGAVDQSWNVNLRLTGSTNRALVRAIDIEGDRLYLAGNFTRITGSDGTERNAANLARVDVDDARSDGTFLPFVDGIVFDVDADGDRVYAVGNFLYVNNLWSIGLAVLQRSNGQLVPNLLPWVRTDVRVNRGYQQAVLSLGSEVWQVGSQHNFQAYQASNYQLIRSFVSDPWGDGQALAYGNGIVYAGNHANGGTFMYTDATSWPGLTGWTSRLPQRWMGAWDNASKTFLDWYPQIGTDNGEGAWELFVDSTDCLWAGGDFNRGSFDGGTARYVGGFAKFCPVDTTPPAPPSNLTAVYRSTDDAVDLAWDPSPGDDRGGEVRYELLKNDSVLASFISITTFRDANGSPSDRYFVRAMDVTGNRSATTPVATAAADDTQRPSTPQNLAATIEGNGDVTLTWTASTDNVGVTGYRVLRTGTQIDTVTTPGYTDPSPAPGSYWYQIQAFDAAGNDSFKTPPVRVDITAGGDDTQNPTTPQNLAATIEGNGDVTLTWTASTDNVGVTGYRVLRTGTQIDTVTTPGYTDPSPAPGSYWYQIQAFDAAGNDSFKTPPVRVDITAGGDDTQNPTTPQNLAAEILVDGSLRLTWTASTDNVGVVEYQVYRNNVPLFTVGGSPAVIPNPPQGSTWWQVQARDAAGNESFKTPPVRVDIGV